MFLFIHISDGIKIYSTKLLYTNNCKLEYVLLCKFLQFWLVNNNNFWMFLYNYKCMSPGNSHWNQIQAQDCLCLYKYLFTLCLPLALHGFRSLASSIVTHKHTLDGCNNNSNIIINNYNNDYKDNNSNNTVDKNA